MMCPILSFRKEYLMSVDCWEEKCAWYTNEKCAIKALAENSNPNNINPQIIRTVTDDDVTMVLY